MHHILVLDDDVATRDVIATYLEGQGLQVTPVADGRSMARTLAERAVDLIILDLKLSNEDGLDLMRGFTREREVPIIVLTGYRRDETDRVVGLELGADDYMTKPFGLRELLARVRAVIRRSERGECRLRRQERRVRYCFAGWELEMRTRRLISPSGNAVPLTAGEFNLLIAFLRSPQQILTREQLLVASHVHDEEVYDRSIDVQILRLRRKLETDPREPRLITTERGAGYVFAAPVETVWRSTGGNEYGTARGRYRGYSTGTGA
jgi:two-component system, OmpR family, response regulator